MMNLETWILISIAILASQYAAIKISERTSSRWHQTISDLTVSPEQAQIREEMAEEELPEESGQAKEAEQECLESQEPAVLESLEEQSRAEHAVMRSLQEIELITAKINELKELLEMSKELKKELQKLAETIDPAKGRKIVN